MHTYGIVMGLSSPKIEIKNTEKIFEAKLPIKIAKAVSEPYKSI